MATVTWDYTEHARHYDKRADYDKDTIREILSDLGCNPGAIVADIGAGTGKLSKLLMSDGLVVHAIEPNDAMRERGIANTVGSDLGGNISWSIGTGESTGLDDASVHAVFFGSSFNVVDRSKTLKEASRILASNGCFCCMWNHRVLDDPVQQRIEAAIKNHITDYGYGSRREDPTRDILTCGLFQDVRSYEGQFVEYMNAEDVIQAWRSHATLRRQASAETIFDEIVSQIARIVDAEARDSDGSIPVPYVTRAWTARLIAPHARTFRAAS